jgi:uncharacterized Tic20 family protein
LILLLTGLAVGSYGGWRLANSLYDEASQEPIKMIELVPGQKHQIDQIQVDATRRVQLAVQLTLPDSDDLAPAVDYQYFFGYQVTTPDGAPLFEQEGVIGADQGARITRSAGSQSPSQMLVEHRLQRIQVPFPGLIDVSFELGPASPGATQPLTVSLLVYDRVSNDVRGLIIGGSLLVLACLLALSGLILLLLQALGSKSRTSPPTAQEGVDDSAEPSPSAEPVAPNLSNNQIRTIAMWCHLSALAGLLVPMGNVIGPLVVWLTQRDKSAFIDDQGKEAINFQLSVMVYAAVCFLLILILVGFLLLLALSFGALALVIIAALQANQGIAYRYPLIIRFIR